jgi:hypothetical protein
VTTKGWEYKPDVIVYATGADVGRHGVGLNIGLRGEGGKELREYWEGIGGPQGYLGLSVPGVSPGSANQHEECDRYRMTDV